MTQLNPAREIVAKLGGVNATARALDLSPSAVSRWMQPPSKHGTGGHIPRRHWPAIIKHAKSEGVRIRLTDLAAL